MANPYIGEIRLFAGNFPPAGWAFCDGQVLAIAENETLFNLIGTTYGGDGVSTFALPDLRGRVPLHAGAGTVLAEQGGVERVTLLPAQMPVHAHALMASADPANSPNPAGHVLAETPTTTPYFAGPPAVGLAREAVLNAGGSQPHTNLQPYLCLHYIISLFGIFPSPN